ncbi:hypothetical protein HXZ95_13920 [Acinetobacter pseudolwoffii]|uniref:hypothetical protein n=1 Tax=Acinetobacter pseudolwoffii TaxID=2053287 RepID=UPI002578CBF1|nr:hypothetical protein [Acinetobacter pseudolwoffii]MDM1345304.1 hypothetical protein [Acinetobacter pseudolwoffii]
MEVPQIVRDNFLSAILTAIIVIPPTYLLTLRLVSDPKVENLEARVKYLNEDLEKYSKDINNLENLKKDLNQEKIKTGALESKLELLEKEKVSLNEDILKFKTENQQLKEKETDFKINNLNYITSQVEILKKEKHQIRNPSSIQVIYGGKSSSKELSPTDLVLENQIQSQINTLQSKLMCIN